MIYKKTGQSSLNEVADLIESKCHQLILDRKLFDLNDADQRKAYKDRIFQTERAHRLKKNSLWRILQSYRAGT